MTQMYRWLWKRIGGRPWTYIARDSYHDYPLVWIIAMLGVGAFIGRFAGMTRFIEALGIALLGVVAGHFFWGTKYVPKEREE